MVRRERELVGRDEVDPADLGRVHADLVGGDVDHALDELRRLRTAGAAVGADRRVVRQHHPVALNRTFGISYTPTDIIWVSIGRIAPRPGYAPARRHDRTVEADDLAVGVHAELGRHHEVAALHERHHVFGAGRDPLHRTSELQRGRGGDEVLDVRRRLGAEAATDPRAHDAQLRGFEAEHRRVRAVQRVRRLMGDPTA